jgi:hypothetical protein
VAAILPTGTTPVSSCISYWNGNVVADFYLNHNPDSSRCRAYMEIMLWDNVSGSRSYWVGPYHLTRTGRYGPHSDHVWPTIPPSHGSAVNRVHFYTCEGVRHHTADSPRVYYP